MGRFDLYKRGEYNKYGQVRTRFGLIVENVIDVLAILGLLSPLIALLCGFIYKIIVTF
jgi:hypothetical protein